MHTDILTKEKVRGKRKIKEKMRGGEGRVELVHLVDCANEKNIISNNGSIPLALHAVIVTY